MLRSSGTRLVPENRSKLEPSSVDVPLRQTHNHAAVKYLLLMRSNTPEGLLQTKRRGEKRMRWVLHKSETFNSSHGDKTDKNKTSLLCSKSWTPHPLFEEAQDWSLALNAWVNLNAWVKFNAWVKLNARVNLNGWVKLNAWVKLADFLLFYQSYI